MRVVVYSECLGLLVWELKWAFEPILSVGVGGGRFGGFGLS